MLCLSTRQSYNFILLPAIQSPHKCHEHSVFGTVDPRPSAVLCLPYGNSLAATQLHDGKIRLALRIHHSIDERERFINVAFSAMSTSSWSVANHTGTLFRVDLIPGSLLAIKSLPSSCAKLITPPLNVDPYSSGNL